MKTRKLGGLEVGAIGLGCMGMSAFYGPTDEAESLATIDRALELGVTLLDTSDMYGPYLNEILVGKALAGASTNEARSRSTTRNTDPASRC